MVLMRLPERLLKRKPSSHKGDFGHIFILAGSARFSGAAALCSEAAMRSGAGLVTLGVPVSLNTAFIKIKLKEVMTLPLPETKSGTFSPAGYKKIQDFLGSIDIAVIGPGLAQNASTHKLVRRILEKINVPAIIDADAIIALKEVRRNFKNLTITPHPGEMARLLGISTKEVQARRKEIAKKSARYYNVTIVLKGHRTVVADYKGNLYINETGNPGMATAGSGDVLAGIIAAFQAQGLDAFNAAKYAVYLHGVAGDLAAKEKTQISLIASDIIAKIPIAIKRCS
jgi:hydroxyethylthiazole kinase-like uncharacterized protein yjeF